MPVPKGWEDAELVDTGSTPAQPLPAQVEKPTVPPGFEDAELIDTQAVKGGFMAGVKHVVPDLAAGALKTAASLATFPSWLQGMATGAGVVEPVTTEESSPWARAMEATIAPERFAPKGITQKIAQIPEAAASIVPFRTPPELRDTGINPLKWKHPVHTISAGLAENIPGMIGAGLTTKTLMKGLGASDKIAKLFTIGKWSPELTKSGLAGASLLAPQISQGFYDEAIKNGADPAIAGPLALTDGVFATLTEGIALPGIVQGKGRWFTRFLKGGVQEGLFEEGVQGAFENTLKIAGWQDPRPIAERMLDGLAQSVIVGFLTGGTLGVIAGDTEAKAVASLVREGVSEDDAKATVVKLAQDGSLAKVVADVLRVGSPIRESVNSKIDLTLDEVSNLREGYILTNAEQEGQVRELRISDKTKIDTERIKNVMFDLTSALQQSKNYAVVFPDAFRKNLELLINHKLESGQDAGEVLNEMLAFFNDPAPKKKVIYLTEPAKDETDPAVSVYDTSSLMVIPLSTFATLNYAKGLTPSDIIVRQNMVKGQKEGFAKAVRSNLKREYQLGLLTGKWVPPAAPPPTVTTPSPEPPPAPQDVAVSQVNEAAAEIIAKMKGQGESVDKVISDATSPRVGSLDNPVKGDIWDKHAAGDIVVIGTNLGGIHGRGLAKQAADKGLVIRGNNGQFDNSNFEKRVLSIAVKKHWSNKTTGKNLELMRSEVAKLLAYAKDNQDKTIWIPYLGMGFGEGIKTEIFPILKELDTLPNVRFIAKDPVVVQKYKESFKPGARQDKTVMEPIVSEKLTPEVEETEEEKNARLWTAYLKRVSGETPTVLSGERVPPVEQLSEEEQQKAALAAMTKKHGPLPKEHKMSYAMPANQNITGKDTTTLRLCELGVRTSTTRSYPLGKVGEEIFFEGSDSLFKITGTYRITKGDMGNPDFLNELSRTEGWTVDAIKTRHKFQIVPGAWVTYFEKVAVAPAPEIKLVPKSDLDEPTIQPDSFAELSAIDKIKHRIAVEDSLRSEINAEDVLAMTEAADALSKSLGRNPTTTELAEALGWSEVYLQDVRKLSLEEFNKELVSTAQQDDIKANAQVLGMHGENVSFVARANIIDLMRNWTDLLRNPTASDMMESAMNWLETRLNDRRVTKEETRQGYRDKYNVMVKAAEDLLAEGKDATPVINQFFFEELRQELLNLPKEDMASLADRLYFSVNEDSITVKDSSGKIAYSVSKSNPSADKMEYVINELETKQADESRAAIPWGMSEAEKGGGASFTIKYEPMTITSDIGTIELGVGEYHLFKVGDNYELSVDGVVHTLPEGFLTSLVDNDNAELNNIDYLYAGLPWIGMDKSVFELLSPIKRFFQASRVDKHKGIVRKQPMRSLIEIMRFFRLNPARFTTFWTGKEEQEELFKRQPRLGPAPETAKSILYKDKVFISAMRQISQMAIRDAYTELEAIVDETIDSRGQPVKQTDRQHEKDMIVALMCYASEQVVVNEQFPVTGKFAFSDNATDKHINADGVLDPKTHRAYYNTILKYHKILNIPYTPADEARWADPNGQREPVYWEMLSKYSGNDKLQRWLLSTKAVIEVPLLNEQLSRGIYANADIWSKIKRGYTRKVFDVTELQKTTGFGKYQKESSLGSKAKPQSTHKTFEEFVQAGETGGWVPIEDYMTSLVDYTSDALSSIHQADTLTALHEVTAPFIHYREELRKVTPANYMPKGTFTVIQYTHSPMIVSETARLSKALGYDISPTLVLESLGFVQGKEMPGLVAWWRGAFQKPWVYKPVADMFSAMFEKTPEGGLSQMGLDLFNLAKHVKTLNPVDSPGVWAGLPYMRLGPVKVITFAPRALYYGTKGIGLGFKQLMGGKPIESTLSPTKHQYLPLALMTGWQCHSYTNAMNSVYDWSQRAGKFPERFNKIERLGDWFRNIGGANAAIFNQMLANDFYLAWERVFLENKSKNMSDNEAAFRASSYMNNASFMLNRSIYNREGRWLNLLAFSRGLFVGAVRNMALMTYRVPLVGPTLKEMGVYSYHTSRLGKLMNSFVNAEMTEMDLNVASMQLLRDTAMLTMYAFISMGMLQYILSFRDDDKRDEHGEIGLVLGDKAKKRNILENEAGGFGKVRLGQAENFRQLYASYMLFRWQKDLQDMVLGTLNQNWGRGIEAWVGGKQGLFASALIKVAKNDDGDGNPIFNPEDELQNRWLDGIKFMIADSIGVIGTEPKLYSEDPFRQQILRGLDLTGFQISFGEPVSMTDWRTARERRKGIRKERFAEEMIEPTKEIRSKTKEELIQMFKKASTYEQGILRGQIEAEIERRNAPEQSVIKRGRTQIKRSFLREPILK